MKTYKITERREGRNSATYKGGMTLKEAQAELLKMANFDLGRNFTNWGLIVAFAPKFNNGYFAASRTAEDGTRSYYYDVYSYEIVEE